MVEVDTNQGAVVQQGNIADQGVAHHDAFGIDESQGGGHVFAADLVFGGAAEPENTHLRVEYVLGQGVGNFAVVFAQVFAADIVEFGNAQRRAGEVRADATVAKYKVAHLFDHVFGAQPAAEFGIVVEPEVVFLADQLGVFEVFIAHVIVFAAKVHGFVVAEDEMDFAAGGFGFRFEFVHQPEAFGDVEAAVEKVAYEHEVAVAESPVQFTVDNLGGSEQKFEGFEIALDIGKHQHAVGHGVAFLFVFQLAFQGKGEHVAGFGHGAAKFDFLPVGVVFHAHQPAGVLLFDGFDDNVFSPVKNVRAVGACLGKVGRIGGEKVGGKTQEYGGKKRFEYHEQTFRAGRAVGGGVGSITVLEAIGHQSCSTGVFPEKSYRKSGTNIILFRGAVFGRGGPIGPERLLLGN